MNKAIALRQWTPPQLSMFKEGIGGVFKRPFVIKYVQTFKWSMKKRTYL